MLLTDFIRLVAEHQELAYAAASLTALVESLALIGLLIPGTLMLFVLGALAASGALRLEILIIAAGLGALAGDSLSYWLGRRYYEQLKKIWPFTRYPGLLSHGENFFMAHGAKSILLGRFIGPLRPVVPMVAGMFGLPALKFGLLTSVSALIWACATIGPGALFGASLNLAGRVSARLTLLILILAASLTAAIWLVRRCLSLLSRWLPLWVKRLEAYASSNPQASQPRRLLAWFMARPLREDLLLTSLGLIVLTAGWYFVGLSLANLNRLQIAQTDQAVYQLLQGLRTTWSDCLFVALAALGDAPVNWAVGLAVLAVLLLKKRRRTAAYWLMTVGGGATVVHLLRFWFKLPRPAMQLSDIAQFSFPSSHTAINLILYSFLALLLSRELHSKRLRLDLISGAVAFSLIISFARLYLGVHWLSDVLGGLALAAAWTGTLSLFYLNAPAEKLPRRLLADLSLAAFIVVACLHLGLQLNSGLKAYAPRHTLVTISEAAWTQTAWQDLPAWRADLKGDQLQPLSLQWAGSSRDLTKCLQTAGWRSVAPNPTKAWLKLLLTSSVSELPLLPQLHNGQREVLLLWRPAGTRRLVLRLWPSDYALKSSGQPILLGAVESQYAQHLILSLPRASHDYNQAIETLRLSLDQTHTSYQLRRRTNHHPNQPENPKNQSQWNGWVLLGGVAK